jgi:hypothetical protein
MTAGLLVSRTTKNKLHKMAVANPLPDIKTKSMKTSEILKKHGKR